MHEIGLNLYKVFKTCLEENKDLARLKRIESRLHFWHSKLTLDQKQCFATLLVKQNLITGTLAEAIKTFNASFVKFI